MYQESDLLVVLLDSTANNSLLEAMACGMPMVTTDLQGVRDYVARSAPCSRKKAMRVQYRQPSNGWSGTKAPANEWAGRAAIVPWHSDGSRSPNIPAMCTASRD